MIALAVLGILCATVLPAIINNTPNQNKMMMKKSYYIFSDVIKEIINDTENYPMIDGICPDNKTDGYVGLDCGGAEKLPYLFAKQVNMDERITGNMSAFKSSTAYSKSSITDCNGASSSCYLLKSSDGLTWAFPKTAFTKGSETSNILIGVDVNGAGRKPDCYQGSAAANCKNRTKNFDQYRIKLYADGVIEINSADTWAKKAINVNSALSEDD